MLHKIREEGIEEDDCPHRLEKQSMAMMALRIAIRWTLVRIRTVEVVSGHVRSKTKSAPVRRVDSFEALLASSLLVLCLFFSFLFGFCMLDSDRLERWASFRFGGSMEGFEGLVGFGLPLIALVFSGLWLFLVFPFLYRALFQELCAALFCLPVCCCSLLVGPSALFKLACPALVFYLSSLCLYVLLLFCSLYAMFVIVLSALFLGFYLLPCSYMLALSFLCLALWLLPFICRVFCGPVISLRPFSFACFAIGVVSFLFFCLFGLPVW
ncbi:hypothetical protein Tco_0011532 [Tanacetum coccineum]